MNKFIILVGLPASGKSTIRKTIFSSAIQVCPDDLIKYTKEEPWTPRTATMAWKISDDFLCGLFENKAKTIVFDATMVSKKKRRKYINFAKQFDYEVYAIFCNTEKNICIERNSKRDLYRQVPQHILEDMSKRLEPPQKDEGFVEIIVYDGFDFKNTNEIVKLGNYQEFKKFKEKNINV